MFEDIFVKAIGYWKAHTLLVGLQNVTILMNEKLAISRKIPYVFIFWCRISTSWALPWRYLGKPMKGCMLNDTCSYSTNCKIMKIIHMFIRNHHALNWIYCCISTTYNILWYKEISLISSLSLHKHRPSREKPKNRKECEQYIHF